MSIRVPSYLIHYAAQRATDVHLIGSALHRLADECGIDWAELPTVLGLSRSQLDRLALCDWPRPAHYDADVAAIAACTAIPESSLAALIKDLGPAR